MFIKVIIVLSLILNSCVGHKSSIPSAGQESKHQIYSRGIHHITAIKEIAPLLQNLDERDLVAWDVDSVILTSNDVIHRPAADIMRAQAVKELADKYGPEKVLLARSKAVQNANWILVDQNIPMVIRDLQNRNVRTIALTAIRTNSFGQIADPMQWRVDSLRALGIHFKWPTHLDKELWEDNTGYLDGVVASAAQPKGVVLLHFLDKAKFMPRTVVFIDDKIANIKNVKELCERAGVKHFYGFHFDAETFAKDKVPDACMLRMQLEEAAQGGAWLHDQEVLDKIRSGEYQCSANPIP